MLSKFVYQVYPKSFLDTNNDGIGDINGVINKLDYIKYLGFDYIWITPIFKSPQNDNGYDIEDYYEIDPIFGTKDDLINLVNEAKKRGIGIMFDLVFNHTSTSHKWFVNAINGSKYYQDYYFFLDSPNNWDSKFGGSAWEYLPKLNKYYLHLYDKTQADLKWSNVEVRKELYDIVNYWLEFGITGFRFDVINVIGKDEELKSGDYSQYTDKTIVHTYLKELRQNTYKDRSDILTVGEMSATSIKNCIKYASKNKEELDTVFNFHHLKVDYKDNYKWSRDYFDFKHLKTLLNDWQTNMYSHGSNMSLFWSNHDQPRIASRFNAASTKDFQVKKSKMLAVAMYLQYGTSFIFQGEEIGTLNHIYTSHLDFKDIESKNFYDSCDDKVEAMRILNQKSRDLSRVPMIWNNEKFGGFSNVNPWINVSNNQVDSVEKQLGNDDSVLNFYRSVITLKKSCDTLINGAYKQLFENEEYIYAYSRSDEKSRYIIITNFYEKFVNLSEYNITGEIILSNDNNNQLDYLMPFGAIVVKI